MDDVALDFFFCEQCIVVRVAIDIVAFVDFGDLGGYVLAYPVYTHTH